MENCESEMMISNCNKSIFEVGNIKLSHLFSSDITLVIPEYQRPYVWDKENISELFNDWEDHFFNDGNFNHSAIEYYMGAIMIHDNGSELRIIDGQQRLTTLLIMDYIWNQENSVLSKGKFNFDYTSHHSIDQIKENQKYLQNFEGSQLNYHFEKILEKLAFSVIITNSEDKAFVFFDSQNNRGVALDEIDFFKSYHLRELNSHECYLSYFAKKFDQMNALNKSNIGNGKYLDNLNDLFKNQLWRLRFWSKNDLISSNRRLLLETFQKNTVTFGAVDVIRLYPSVNNILGKNLIFDYNLNTTLEGSLKQRQSESLDIPFTIGQPIQKGIGFFLYTEKYSSLFNHLFRNEKVTIINPVTKLIYNIYNSYFISLYHSCVIMYYDKFGEEKIGEFVKWLEHFMGAFRMNRYSVVEQSQIVLLRDYGNVLMEIRHSFLPEEINHFLRKKTPENYYANFKYHGDGDEFVIQSNDKKTLSSARQSYYQKVKEFYQKEIKKDKYQLTEKRNWIYESINQEK
jgi:hypothetical protein